MAMPFWAATLIETVTTWCLDTRCWRWLRRRRQVQATATDAEQVDRAGNQIPWTTRNGKPPRKKETA